jgi:ribonuclease HI
MGFACVLKDDSGKIRYEKACMYRPEQWPDTTSNNTAEYLALQLLINYCVDYHRNDNLIFAGDSQLVVNQCLGKWQIKGGMYARTAEMTIKLLKLLPKATVQWIRRDHNTEADALSKSILKENGIAISEWRK